MKKDLRVTCGSRLDVPAASASDDPNANQNMRRPEGSQVEAEVDRTQTKGLLYENRVLSVGHLRLRRG
jgi:hypothetical protein